MLSIDDCCTNFYIGAAVFFLDIANSGRIDYNIVERVQLRPLQDVGRTLGGYNET